MSIRALHLSVFQIVNGARVLFPVLFLTIVVPWASYALPIFYCLRLTASVGRRVDGEGRYAYAERISCTGEDAVMTDFFDSIGNFFDDTADAIGDRIDEIKAKNKEIDDKIDRVKSQISQLTAYKKSISSYRDFMCLQRDSFKSLINTPIEAGKWQGVTRDTFDANFVAVLGDFHRTITRMDNSINDIEEKIKSLKGDISWYNRTKMRVSTVF